VAVGIGIIAIECKPFAILGQARPIRPAVLGSRRFLTNFPWFNVVAVFQLTSGRLTNRRGTAAPRLQAWVFALTRSECISSGISTPLTRYAFERAMRTKVFGLNFALVPKLSELRP